MASSPRRSRAERQAAVLEVAAEEFGRRGLYGTSAEDIAAAANLSQPYIFQLFGTKRELFTAVVRHSYAMAITLFVESAAGLEGQAAFDAIRETCMKAAGTRAPWLQVQLQAHAAFDDDAIKALVQESDAELTRCVERVSRNPPRVTTQLLAEAMILSVRAA